VGRSAPSHQDFRKAALACFDGLFGFAYSLCRDRVAAEDLVQETYVRALAARRKAAPEDNLRGWLFTILHNVWRNEVRRPRPAAMEDWPGLAESLAAPGKDPQQTLHEKETGQRLRRAIADLPEPFREVVMLRCVEGFSYRDVASIVGCPAGTVMSRLARGRALLRQSLEASDGGGSG
jgi:RNA polymerase sigma-70 factor, ECF subfamily